MVLFNTINYYLNIIMVVSFVTVTALGGILYYLLKIRKVTAKTENVDYSSFERTDSMEYVKLQDIISQDPDDLKSPGVIALGENVFVAGISVDGYNYSSASAGERERTMMNAITFANRITGPIQMRQTTKAIDLSYNIDIYDKILKERNMELMEATEEYENTIKASYQYEDDPKEYEAFLERIEVLKRNVITHRHEVEEANAIIRYMNAMSNQDKKNRSVNSQKINQILFSYSFDSSEYTEELSKEEIYEKAVESLATQAASYGEGLLACGCTYKRLSARELVELMRGHLQPLSSNEIKLEDVLNSDYRNLYITSESLVQYELDRRGEVAYMSHLAEYQREQKEELDLKRMEAREARQKLVLETKRLANRVEKGMVG